jgi:hypothetical protein
MIKRQMYEQLQKLRMDANESQLEFVREVAARAREPNANETTVEDTRIPSKSDAIQLFRWLESVGCGELIVGRRKMKTRFRWGRQGAIVVAKAILGEAIDFTEDGSELSEPLATVVHDRSSYKHKFLLRSNLSIDITLPLDLTREEASRLADFIRSIPF